MSSTCGGCVGCGGAAMAWRKRTCYLGMLVGVGDEYFEDMEGFELDAAAAVAQGIHDHLGAAWRESGGGAAGG